MALAYQAHAFSKAYTDVADSFQEAMLHESQKIESLETARGESEVYRGMVAQVTATVTHVTASLVRANTQLDDKALAQLLRETCDKTAIAFSRSRSVPCRVCVKQVMEKPDEPGRPYVKAVARNTGVTRDDKKRWHLVEDNTDFDALLFSQLDYWFCPDVQDRTLVPQYSNTSPGDHPYRSVIVWPIKARTGKSDERSLSDGYDVAAFLCLDANEPNAFDEVSDVPMGALVAQALGRAFEAHYASFPTSNTNREKSE
ncbi:MAG: hypothetical protein EOL91_02605 [Actinobacteria bacterium]|nr:hypothetical protein [Actinomycetota bacterium]